MFFFLLYVTHLYLHSFPTRRSSDLVVYQNLSGTESLWASHLNFLNYPSGPIAVRWYQFDVTGGNFPANAVQRSEEHTSELQSLTNLVCRLLLEKKKKKINNTKISIL